MLRNIVIQLKADCHKARWSSSKSVDSLGELNDNCARISAVLDTRRGDLKFEDIVKGMGTDYASDAACKPARTQAAYRRRYQRPPADGAPDACGYFRQRRRTDDPGCNPQTLVVGEAPVRRRRLRLGDAHGQGSVPGLQRRDHPALGRRKRLRGSALPLGRRADPRLYDPLATSRAALRAACRCLRGHDPYGHGQPHATQKRPSVNFQKGSNGDRKNFVF